MITWMARGGCLCDRLRRVPALRTVVCIGTGGLRGRLDPRCVPPPLFRCERRNARQTVVPLSWVPDLCARPQHSGGVDLAFHLPRLHERLPVFGEPSVRGR